MLPLVIEITDQNGIQWRPPFRNLRFTKTFYGGEDLLMVFVLDRAGDLDYPDVAYGNDVILRNGLAPRFAGEIRQIESDLETVTVKVLGRFVYLDDYGYEGMGKLWCDSRYGRWKPITDADLANHTPEKYLMDAQNRVYIAVRKDEDYGNNIDMGAYYYWCPYDNIERVSFDYDAKVWDAGQGANWIFELISADAAFGAQNVEWTMGGGGALPAQDASGVKDVTLDTPRPLIMFRLRHPWAIWSPALTAQQRAIITNLRLWGENGPLSKAIESPSVFHVAEDIIGQVQAATSISADEERVQESLFVRDTFTDTPGTLLTAHTPDINKQRGLWNEAVGNWDIQGNEARCFTAGGVAIINAGIVDGIVCVDTTTVVTGLQSEAIVFRYQDINNYWQWMLRPDTGQVFLGYYQAAGWNTVWSSDIGIQEGYTYNLMVKLRGDRIDCYVGGIWRYGTNNALFQTETEHGISSGAMANLTFDNFEVFQALPIWPLFYERDESCHKALKGMVSYGDWDFRTLGWGVEPGGNRLYLKRADRSKVRYIVPPHHASRLSAKGQTDKEFVTEAWGKYIDEDGVERWTEKYYAHITPTGIVANTTPPVAGDSSAQTVYGIQRERTINFGREDAILAVEYLRQYLEEHAHPQVKSSFEIFGPVQDRFKGGAWIQPYELEMGYVVQIPYFRAVEVDSVAGSDIRWDVGGGSDTTFLLVAMQYDVEKGRARLIPEGDLEELERLMKYSREFERGQERQLKEKRAEASFKG